MATFGEHRVTIIDTAELERLRDELATLRAKADAVRNDDAERQRIAGEKVLSCGVTPGFGLTPDKYEVNGKPATREQYLFGMFSLRAEEAANLRRERDTLSSKLRTAENMVGDLQLEAQAAQASEAVERRKRIDAEGAAGVWRRAYKDAEQKANHSDAFKRKAEKYEAALASILSETKLDTEYPWLKIGRIQSIVREATK